MKIKACITFVAILLGFLSSLVHAQRVTIINDDVPAVPYSMVEVVENNIGHTTCVAYKHTGFPIYFMLRTTREDIFFQKLEEIKKCLLLVKIWSDNPNKYISKMMLVPEFPRVIPPLSGIYEDIRCTRSDAENSKATLTEFSFPYLMGKDDIASFLQERRLRICLNTMKSTELPPLLSKDWIKEG